MELPILSPGTQVRVDAIETLETGLPPTGVLQADPNPTLEDISTNNADDLALIDLEVEELTIVETTGLIFGTSANELIVGTDGIDEIKALGGNDLVFGRLSNDTIYGGDGSNTSSSGSDNLVGQGGNDFIKGEDRNDFLYGDSTSSDNPDTEAFGNDTLDGGVGSDFLDGGMGNDNLLGGRDVDTLFGGNGVDSLLGDLGSDLLYGGFDNDSIDGGSQNDLAFGEDGNDLISGGSGNDSLYGDRADRIRDAQGTDTLFGNDGNDTLIGQSLSDSLNGGSNNDLLIGVNRPIGVNSEFPQLNYGLGDIDTLTGARGNDNFVLGQADGNVYYNDDNPNEVGIRDYALITDFSLSGTNGTDKIELAGEVADYSLGSQTADGSGLGIFWNENEATSPELIAVLQNANLTQLDLNNASQFTFVQIDISKLTNL